MASKSTFLDFSSASDRLYQKTFMVDDNLSTGNNQRALSYNLLGEGTARSLKLQGAVPALVVNGQPFRAAPFDS